MLCNTLKVLRLKCGKAQKEVALDLGIDYKRYNHYETGRSEPDIATILQLSEYFGVTTDLLLGYIGHSEKSDRFKCSLEKTLQWIDCCGDLTEPEAQEDYAEAMGYAESPYVLTIDEIYRASELVGESIDDMLSEKFEPGMRGEAKKSPNAERSTSEDLMNGQIMSLVRKMPEEQKVLLLSLLQTTVERNQGTLLSVQPSASEESTKS